MRSIFSKLTWGVIAGYCLVFSASQALAGSVEQNKAFIQKYFAAISGRDKPAATLDLYVTDEELKKHVGFFETSFPQFSLVSEDMVGEGDKVSVRVRFAGVHKGDLMGIQPTGKSVDVPFIIIYRIADGRIAEHWMSLDQTVLLKQLGVMK